MANPTGRTITDSKGVAIEEVLSSESFIRVELTNLRGALANENLRRFIMDSAAQRHQRPLAWLVDDCVFDTRDVLDAQLLRLAVVLAESDTSSVP
jgi:hypothetical protein